MTDVDAERLLDEPSYFVRHYLKDEPFWYQEEFMDHDSNRKAFVSGRRVGKSRTASWMALWYAITHSNAEILITAKAQRQSTELFNQVKKDIRTSQISEDDWGITRQTRTEINFDNGSRVKCLPVGTDGANIRGFGTDLLIVDEAAFIPDRIFKEVLAPFLAVGDGTFVLLSTPLGKNGYLYDRFNEARGDGHGSDPDTNWYAKQVPTSENPLIDEEFIERQKRQLSSRQFKQEYLGQFDEKANSFFTRDDLMNCAVAHVDRQANDPVFLGVDLAGQGADESVYTSIDASGNIFDISVTTDGLSESMHHVNILDNRYDYRRILLDSTGLGEGPVEQLQALIGRKVKGFKFTNEKKQSLYNTLKSELQNGDLAFEFVPGKDRAENKMFNQMLELQYKYTQTGRVKIYHPPGGYDDYCDSLALAVWSRSQKNMARVDSGSMRPFTLGSLR
jgi:hypothetical protein